MATECPAVDGSSPRQTKFDGPMPMCIDAEKSYQAEIVTNHGTMTAYLYPERAPKTVNNFVSLARYHYYDSLTFHRTPAQQTRDRQRDHAHAIAELLPLRFTHSQITYEPAYVCETLAAVGQFHPEG